MEVKVYSKYIENEFSNGYLYSLTPTKEFPNEITVIIPDEYLPHRTDDGLIMVTLQGRTYKLTQALHYAYNSIGISWFNDEEEMWHWRKLKTK